MMRLQESTARPLLRSPMPLPIVILLRRLRMPARFPTVCLQLITMISIWFASVISIRKLVCSVILWFRISSSSRRPLSRLLLLVVISLATKFRTHYDKFKVQSKTGERVEPIYSAHYDEDGVLVLMQTGKRDIYDEIQSHKDSVDINVLMKRFQNGDTSALTRVQGIYADYTGFPKDYQGILNTVVDAEQIFAALPVDVKNHFGNSFSKWLVAGGLIDFDYQSIVDKVRSLDDGKEPAPVDDVPVKVDKVDNPESGDE